MKLLQTLLGVNAFTKQVLSLPTYKPTRPKGHTFKRYSPQAVAKRQAETLDRKNRRRATNNLPPLTSYSQL